VPVSEPNSVTPSDGSDLRRELLDTQDTVTHFLEMLAGESLIVDVVRQELLRVSPGNCLGVAAGQSVMHRIAILKGRATELAYVYAESIFAPDRLPEQVSAQLEGTDDPIGRVLVAHGLKLKREFLPDLEADPEVELVDEVVFTRAYRLMIDGSPGFAIREWFLRAALEALDRQTQN
jgi:chorismate-pyruvate lyase